MMKSRMKVARRWRPFGAGVGFADTENGRSKIALKEDTRPSLLMNQKSTGLFAGKN